ncbi:SlyX family protein [Aliidiomarina halalkaliphila]|uniref:Protein SlyX homolog n=2 Tax=Aliidiomarina halalkaliphila TaxID=2593535 RepID=A0A552X0B7_9GAMM|nr:SlyX family protein [Aliidiomarina halalkaliphila]
MDKVRMSKESPKIDVTVNEIAERMERLETQLAFQEDTIAELNDLITEQNRELQKLHKHMILMVERVQQLDDDQKDAPIDERPPHY